MQDPYGYKESVNAEDGASRAMWNGVIAAICAGTGMCACYIPFFIGAPLGLYAAWMGNKALAQATEPRDRAMATAGMVSGLAGGVVCLAWSLFILMYALFFFMYFVLIFVLVGAGAMSQ